MDERQRMGGIMDERMSEWMDRQRCGQAVGRTDSLLQTNEHSKKGLQMEMDQQRQGAYVLWRDEEKMAAGDINIKKG